MRCSLTLSIHPTDASHVFKLSVSVCLWCVMRHQQHVNATAGFHTRLSQNTWQLHDRRYVTVRDT